MKAAMARGFLPVFLLTCALAAEAPQPLVVVNSNNPVTTLTRAQLKKLLTGAQAKWPSGEKVVLLTTPPGSAERSSALQAFCDMTEQQLNTDMIHASFVGEERIRARIVPTGKSIVQAVQATPGAIGFVGEADITDQVRLVHVE